MEPAKRSSLPKAADPGFTGHFSLPRVSARPGRRRARRPELRRLLEQYHDGLTWLEQEHLRSLGYKNVGPRLPHRRYKPAADLAHEELAYREWAALNVEQANGITARQINRAIGLLLQQRGGHPPQERAPLDRARCKLEQILRDTPPDRPKGTAASRRIHVDDTRRERLARLSERDPLVGASLVQAGRQVRREDKARAKRAKQLRAEISAGYLPLHEKLRRRVPEWLRDRED